MPWPLILEHMVSLLSMLLAVQLPPAAPALYLELLQVISPVKARLEMTFVHDPLY